MTIVSQFLQVQITVADHAAAQALAHALVSERLLPEVTCQDLDTMRSSGGEVRRGRAHLLCATIPDDALDALAARVRESQGVPGGHDVQLIATPVQHIDGDHADRLRAAVPPRPSSHLEVERKYSLANASLPPDPADWPGVSLVSGERRFRLVATYFDTADLVLAREGITVRRRIGGTDAGWHLKLPRTDDAREEIWLPLEAADEATGVPPTLRSRVARLLGDRPLAPVCTVETRRTEWDLHGGGVHLATTCDDYVTTHNLLHAGQDREWHEMEVELVHGGLDFLDAVTAHLRTHGVQQASIASKLRAALDPAAQTVAP